MSIQDLRPNSTDISAAYLANIFQLLADRDGSHVFIPSSLSPPSSDFSVPKHAVWVNTLWFLSLVISISCALSATFVQQWAHRYVKVTASEELYCLHKQARIRAFFAEGLDKSRLPLVVELIPTFLHLSVFLFFAGLCVFLYNLNSTAFDAVISFVGVCVLTYLYIIVMPIVRYDTPYHSPLSSLVWYIWTLMLCIFFSALTSFVGFGFVRRWFIRIPYFSYKFVARLHHFKNRYHKRYMDGIRKAAEESALKLSSEIDGRALVWTVKSLDRDDEQEQFFANIPAFCDSKALTAPQDALKGTNRVEMSEALVEFLHNTLSSNLDQNSKKRRIDICRSASDAVSLSVTWRIYHRVVYDDWTGLLNSVEFGLLLNASKSSDPFEDSSSKHLIACIIATVQEHDGRWFELATGQLGISISVLENYLTHGDSVLLANCIGICRYELEALSRNNWTYGSVTRSGCLEIVSNFNAQNTLPDLKHEFCGLWNELIRMARDSANRRMSSLAINILRHIHHIYFTLHEGTDAAPTAFNAVTDDYANVLFDPSSYPSCNIPEHATRIDQATARSTGESAHHPAPTSPTVTSRTEVVIPFFPAPHLSHSTTRFADGMSLSEVRDAPQPTAQAITSSCPTQECL